MTVLRFALVLVISDRLERCQRQESFLLNCHGWICTSTGFQVTRRTRVESDRTTVPSNAEPRVCR